MRYRKRQTQRSHEKPRAEALAFCQCSECNTSLYVLSNGEVIHGRQVSIAQHKEHLSRDERARNARKLMEEAKIPDVMQIRTSPVNTSDEQSSPITTVDATEPQRVDLPTAASGNRRSRRARAQAGTANPFLSGLISLRHRLQSRPVSVVCGDLPLVFRRPPTRNDLPDGPISDIDPYASQNDAFLRHGRWLQEARQRVGCQLRNEAKNGLVHERLLAALVERNIDSAIQDLEQFKASEWKRQHELSLRLKAPTVDTGAYSIRPPCIPFLIPRDPALSEIDIKKNTIDGAPHLSQLSARRISLPFGRSLSGSYQHVTSFRRRHFKAGP